MYGLEMTYIQEAILTMYYHSDSVVHITSDAVACLATISSINSSVARKNKLITNKQYITITAISKHFCPGDVWHWKTICSTS